VIGSISQCDDIMEGNLGLDALEQSAPYTLDDAGQPQFGGNAWLLSSAAFDGAFWDTLQEDDDVDDDADDNFDDDSDDDIF
jgi:hypothetical protein